MTAPGWKDIGQYGLCVVLQKAWRESPEINKQAHTGVVHPLRFCVKIKRHFCQQIEMLTDLYGFPGFCSSESNCIAVRHIEADAALDFIKTAKDILPR